MQCSIWKSSLPCLSTSRVVALCGVLAWAGCGSGDPESGPGGIELSSKAVSVDLVSPPCAEPGSVSGYIEGNGFGAQNVTITVGGVEAQVLSATGRDASFVVPEGIPSGPIEVVVTNPGGRIATINWVTCGPSCVPTGPELCDGIDNDCNGAADDGIADLVSGSDVGECQPEIQRCVNGAFAVIQTLVGPGVEVCDGLDNDCDATPDNDVPDVVTGSDVGECQPQVESCVNGTFVISQVEIGPIPETCDSLDNDCNGIVDDEPVCEPTCVPTGAEVCDGVDNDCNGVVDDGIADLVTGSDVGECQPQIETCANGVFVIAQAAIGPAPESCDGLDNDCNGVADDGIADLVTGSDFGECQPQIETCANGVFVISQFEIGPSPESCDGLDNDCNGAVDDAPECSVDLEVARVELTPAGLVLTQQGETYQLTAQAFNAAGQPIDATFTWTSSDPAAVSVDSMGLLEAMVGVGSAQVVAVADGIASSPAFIAVATPVPGAVFISDSQVVVEPSYDGPPEDFGVGSEVRLTVEGVSGLSLGDILLPLETLSIGGRVTDVQETSPNVYSLRLEVIPLDQMYEEYSINETIQLSVTDAIPGELVEQFYEPQLQPDGSYLFLLKPQTQTRTQTQALRAGPIGTKRMYQCEADPDGLLGTLLTVDALPASISIQQNISLIVRWDSDPATENRIAVKAELEGNLSSRVLVSAAIEGKYRCEAELLRFPIPVIPLGPFYGGGIVPIGLGWEFGGKLAIGGIGVEFGIKPKAMVEAGLVCPVGQSCDAYATGSVDVDPVFEQIFPDLSALAPNLRIEPSITGFAYAELEIGVDLFITRIAFSTLKLQAGPVQEGTFALVEGQIGDLPGSPDYKSEYKLSFDVTAQLGDGIKKLKDILSINTPLNPQIKLSGVLFNSPTLASATVDINAYEPQDTVTFDIKLRPEDVNYLPFMYNVDEIIIYERSDAGGQTVATEVVSATPISSGQTDFAIEWTPTANGTIDDNFFATVETVLLPKLPDPVTFGVLELGQVTAPKEAGRIVFQSNRAGNLDIFVMNADGSDQTNLTEDPASDTTPTWFPDGTTVGFTSNRDGERDIWTMDAVQGALQTNLTDTNLSEESWPAWSPDGTRVAFDLQNSLGREIYVMNDDGSNRTNLSNASGTDTIATWSPDGTQIAFAATRDGDFEIYVMNADGSDQTNLTNDAALDSAPSWSPDGTKIAFWSDRDGNREVYVMNADGSGVQRLTNNPARDTSPTWSPDGTEIAFRSDRDGNSEIYVMNADGTGQRNLTQNPASDTNPRWSPTP